MTLTRILRDENNDAKLHTTNYSILPVALPLMVPEALHGVVKLPVAVHVKLNRPPGNVVVLAVETTTPSLSVHV